MSRRAWWLCVVSAAHSTHSLYEPSSARANLLVTACVRTGYCICHMPGLHMILAAMSVVRIAKPVSERDSSSRGVGCYLHKGASEDRWGLSHAMSAPDI
eukprot:2048261-Rhodomonas_salina.1